MGILKLFLRQAELILSFLNQSLDLLPLPILKIGQFAWRSRGNRSGADASSARDARTGLFRRRDMSCSHCSQSA